MDLKKWPIFKSGTFRQAKYLFAPPVKAQHVVVISESGDIWDEYFPIDKNFMKPTDASLKREWALEHALKLQVCKDGIPTGDDSILLISERTYLPLDALGILGPEDRASRASLKDTGRTIHAQARAQAGAFSSHKDIANLVIQGCFILLGILLVLSLFKGG